MTVKRGFVRYRDDVVKSTASMRIIAEIIPHPVPHASGRGFAAGQSHSAGFCSECSEPLSCPGQGQGPRLGDIFRSEAALLTFGLGCATLGTRARALNAVALGFAGMCFAQMKLQCNGFVTSLE